MKVVPQAIRRTLKPPYTELPGRDDDWTLGEVHDGMVLIENHYLKTSFHLSVDDIEQVTPEQRGERYGVLWLRVQLTTYGDRVESAPLPRSAFPDGASLFPKREPHHDDTMFQSAPAASEWIAFSNAYSESARILARTVKGNIDAMPMVFVYRHAIELRIKAILLDFGGIPKAEHKALFTGHPLTSHIDRLNEIGAGAQVDGVSQRLDDFLRNFEAEDENGMRARYPWDRDSNPSLIPNSDSFHASLFVRDANQALDELAELYWNLLKARDEPDDVYK